MPVGALRAAIVAVIFFYGVLDFDNANTVVASTFLLGYGRHWLSPLLGFNNFVVVMRKEVIDHDRQNAVHARIRHRVKYLLTAPFRLKNPRGT